jgi:rare lipoprotein A
VLLAASGVTPASATAAPAAPAPAATPAPTGGVPAPEGSSLAGSPPSLVMPTGGALAASPLTHETLQAPAGALLGQVTVVRGDLNVSDSDRGVFLEVFDAQHGWKVAATGRTNAIGAFAIPLRPSRLGRLSLRATTTRAATVPTSPSTPTAPLEVYQAAVATIFGDGSYGTRTACGQTLTPQLLGVAHLTLPCGTPVAITYGGRSITVPVIDRGPYVPGRSYDLTTATANAIGFTVMTGVATIGVRAPA